MRTTSKMTVYGMTNYYPSLFDGFRTPDGVDRKTCINNILLELGDLEVVYPDPVFFATAIYHWTLKELPIWQEMYDTTQYEYNPIWNKDGTFTETISGKTTGGRTETRDLKSTNNSQTSGQTRDEDYVVGYNTSNPVESGEQHGQTSGQASGVGTDTGTIKTAENGSNDQTITRLEQGNIGVTSTQSMIKEQREVVQFNIIDHIINDFKTRFCVLVY